MFSFREKNKIENQSALLSILEIFASELSRTLGLKKKSREEVPLSFGLMQPETQYTSASLYLITILQSARCLLNTFLDPYVKIWIFHLLKNLPFLAILHHYQTSFSLHNLSNVNA